MNIDRLNQNLASSAYGLRGKRAGEAAAAGEVSSAAESAAGEGAVRADGVELSDEARLLQRAAAAVNAAPDVREDVVERLQSQVQRGQYTPNDQAVARALLGEQP